MNTTNHLKVRKIVFSGVALALATIISTFLKLPSLPMGGSATLFSMLVVTLIGYFYGPATGFTCSAAYGLLQLLIEPYIIHPIQAILDYPLAFGALGISGLFCHRKNGLAIGYICSVMGRLFFSSLSGLIFFTSYVGDTRARLYAALASIGYNCSYLIPEMIISLLILAIPAVKNAINRIKQLSLNAD